MPPATVSPTGRCKRIRRPTAKTACSTYRTGTTTASVRFREQTIPSSELLSSSSWKNSGYHTIHCGKAHFGAIDTPGEDPHHWGFEVNIAGHAAGGLASYLGEENYGHTKDGKPTSLMSIPGLEKYWGTETFATEALTLEAIKALDKAKKYNQPFYLYMSHYAIHIPLNKDMRFYEKYQKEGNDRP